ncbi:hypothetical protein Hanom_Chr07g00584151 [Helianthus anomalus]
MRLKLWMISPHHGRSHYGCDAHNLLFNRQMWIIDGPMEYHRATSGTTRNYPSPLVIMPIHQFIRKPNKYEKNLVVDIEPRIY